MRIKCPCNNRYKSKALETQSDVNDFNKYLSNNNWKTDILTSLDLNI